MLFQTSFFCFLFLLFVLFYLVPKVVRKYILLIASIVFILWQGKISGLIVITAVSFAAFLLGHLINFLNKKGAENVAKFCCGIGIVLFAFALFGWKYIFKIADIFNYELSEDFVNIGVPVGLSFFIFQAISYISDVSLKKIGAWKNPLSFALYMMWFPKWMSGPIERAEDFYGQIENASKVKLFDKDRAIKAITYIVWGLFLKLVIADRIAIVVDTVFADKASYGFGVMMLTSLLYTIQIYCDFSGYTNNMIGISLLFGIELTQNFRIPYFSENVVEFWRRWHISLSNFLKDYIYIPLGGNRKGQFRKAINTLVVFFVCGMWHGAGLNFIVWGLFHGMMNVITVLIKRTRAEFFIKGISGRVITFFMVSFAWIFFRAESLNEALIFIKGMIPGVNTLSAMAGFVAEENSLLGISVMEWWIAFLAIVVLTILEGFAFKKDSLVPEEAVFCWGLLPRTAFITLLTIIILIFGRYGAGEQIRSFVYMQF